MDSCARGLHLYSRAAKERKNQKLTNLFAPRYFPSPSCAVCSVVLFDYLVVFSTIDCGLQSDAIRLSRGTCYYLTICWYYNGGCWFCLCIWPGLSFLSWLLLVPWIWPLAAAVLVGVALAGWPLSLRDALLVTGLARCDCGERSRPVVLAEGGCWAQAFPCRYAALYPCRSPRGGIGRKGPKGQSRAEEAYLYRYSFFL